jgi:sialate O-acetylesterase
MKTIKYNFALQLIISSLVIAVFLVSCNNVNAEDLKKVIDLSGHWKFSIGDDKDWANANFDDSDWDQIRVPDTWENNGYEEYNGFAWYRKTFRVGDIPKNEIIYLMVGRIDDVDEVYLNGKLVGSSGTFPPNVKTAYNHQRKYVIPREYINQGGMNTIAVRVYDTHQGGGIVGGKVGIYRDKDNGYLDYVITGQWKFHIGDNEDWRKTYYNDSDWESISVPSEWESIGYSDYDGYGWYRKEFIVNQNFSEDELYLCLGVIDDYDQVFLNGKPIGNIFKLRKEMGFRKGQEYRVRRAYKIPEGVLKTRGTNVLAVRVYDAQIRGGIYEGPFGIMTKSNYKKYKKKYSGWRYENSFLSILFDL